MTSAKSGGSDSGVVSARGSLSMPHCSSRDRKGKRGASSAGTGSLRACARKRDQPADVSAARHNLAVFGGTIGSDGRDSDRFVATLHLRRNGLLDGWSGRLG